MSWTPGKIDAWMLKLPPTGFKHLLSDQQTDTPNRMFHQNFGPGVFIPQGSFMPPVYPPIGMAEMQLMARLAAESGRENFTGCRLNLGELIAKNKATVPDGEEIKGGEGQKPEDLSPVERGMSEVINDKDKYQITLDVPHFTLPEITVKIVREYLVVECKHEERPDQHGLISRSFIRKYILPQDVDPLTVASSLKPGGTLVVHAAKTTGETKGERKIRIDLAPPGDFSGGMMKP